MTARPPQDVDDHRCWGCGRTVAGAVCMGPHEDLRSHPEWCEYVYRVAAKPLPPAAVVDIPLERQPGQAAGWRCQECGEVFPNRVRLRAHVARNDLIEMGRAIDAWIGEEVAS